MTFAGFPTVVKMSRGKGLCKVFSDLDNGIVSEEPDITSCFSK